MDQHPIPQDVTGFQFKLIGSMTVKQFGFVATGVIMAVLFYYLPLSGFFGILFKIFAIPFFGASGFIIAFVPIDGRSIDVMVGNFTKALFSPNQYVYHKLGKKFSFSTVNTHKSLFAQNQTTSSHPKQEVTQKTDQLRSFLKESVKSKPKSALDEKEAAFISSFAPAPQTTPQAAISSHPTKNIPMLQQAQQILSSIKPVQTITHQTPNQTPQQTKKAIQDTTNPIDQNNPTSKNVPEHNQAPAAKPIDAEPDSLHKQIQEAHNQKLRLEKELADLKAQLGTRKTQPEPEPSQAATQMSSTTTTPAQPTKPTETNTMPATQPQQATTSVAPTPSSTHVRSIPKEQSKKMGLLAPDTPNVIVGVVKDARGNLLPNVLVEVKDREENPVRAFKTNPLGQFVSATPLLPGAYTISLEDPKKQHTFDEIQITAGGQILPPIEIISYDAREQLRRELFN